MPINNLIKRSWNQLKKEPFFVATLLLLILSSFFSVPHVSSIHWNVLSTLFCLMLVCLAFEQCNFLSALACRAIGLFRTPRKLGLAMILVTGALSMVVTNDVALLTVVPLTIMMAKMSGRNPAMLIILETISANIFSAMTPFGNPQNLYLYSFYQISTSEFFRFMVPLCLLGALLLIAVNFLFNKGAVYTAHVVKPQIRDHKLLLGASIAFLVNILSVLRVLDYRIALAATVLIFLLLAPRLMIKVDYFLILTFVLFFLFTDSITGIELIRGWFSRLLHSPSSVLLVSAGVSQVISNVPAAVVVSGFTANYRELLYGVSAGGLGTLIASLASLISYKFYRREYPNGPYLKWFYLLNFALLALLLAGILLSEKIFL